MAGFGRRVATSGVGESMCEHRVARRTSGNSAAGSRGEPLERSTLEPDRFGSTTLARRPTHSRRRSPTPRSAPPLPSIVSHSMFHFETPPATPRIGVGVKRLSFRTRVFLYLLLFAVVPSAVLLLGGAVIVARTVPVLSGSGAWEAVAESGMRAIEAARETGLSPVQRAALDEHEEELAASLTQARRLDYLGSRAPFAALVLALFAALAITVIASRVAGHLSRQFSRPLDEVVGWTELISRGRPLPDGPPARGAPEFEVLRRRMRRMAGELRTARETELEAGRLEAFREVARRVAHELKNPLTPIRFAIARLRADAPPGPEVIEVLETESRRLEQMARSFAQFGKLPEGPVAEIDVGEMAAYLARATVPGDVDIRVEVEPGLPHVIGQHEALSRALTNILINAVDACRDGQRSNGDGACDSVAEIVLHVRRTLLDGREAVAIVVRDSGPGISEEVRARLWDPYVTTKAGGTGLGLAIVRQTVHAHGGVVGATSDGGGTEIRLIFPASADRDTTSPAATSAGSQRG